MVQQDQQQQQQQEQEQEQAAAAAAAQQQQALQQQQQQQAAPPQRIQSALLDRFEAAKGDITTLRNQVDVDDASWATFAQAVSGRPDGVLTVRDLAYLSDVDTTAALVSVPTALMRSRIGLLYDACREACGLRQALTHTMPAAPAAELGMGPPPKRAKMATFVDSVDDSSFDLLPPLNYSALVERTRNIFGELDDDQLPSREQLSGLQAKLNDGGIPFVDFGVWAPRQRHRLKDIKLTKWTFGCDGQAEKVSAPSLPSHGEWKKSFTIYKFGLVMLGAASVADLEAYQSQVDHLYSTYGDEHWCFLVEADELMRSSRLARYASNRNDVKRWGEAFRSAAADHSFWSMHMDRRVFKVERERGSVARKGDGVTSGKQESPATQSRGSKDRSREICFAYQRGAEGHAGAQCPLGRRHVCLACKQSHALPRGNRDCPTRRTTKAPEAPMQAGRGGGLKGEGKHPNSTIRNNEALINNDLYRGSKLITSGGSSSEQTVLGGLRRTVLSTELLKDGRCAFHSLKKKLESIVLPRLSSLRDVGRSALPPSLVDEARRAIANFGGAGDEAVEITNPYSPLRGHLWEMLISAAGDWDVEIPKWLSAAGAPIGVTQTIRPCAIFPMGESSDQEEPEDGALCIWERLAESSGAKAANEADFKNYPSAEQRPDVTMELLRAEERQGFCEIFQSRSDLVAALGSEEFLVSRLALAPKPNGKWRLICDATASGLNDAVETSENVVLPRASDLVEDALDMAQHDGGFQNLEFLSVDFRSAFKLIAVAGSERFCQICRFGGFFVKFNVLMFGTRSSPLVFCRVSSCACRLAQLLYAGSELRISCYVDDPAVIVRGPSPAVRKLRMLTVLLLWEALGIPLAVEKGQRGPTMKWIGMQFALYPNEIQVSVPTDKISAMGELASEMLATSSKVSSKCLRKFCGKAAWAGDVVPYVFAFLAPLWRVSAYAQAKQKSHVALSKAQSSLWWLWVFLRSAFLQSPKAPGSHCLTRSFRLSCRKPPRVCIVVDASTTGIGGILMWGSSHDKAFPVSYFADIVSEHDVRLLGVERGSCKSQSCLELFAIIVALKLWASRLADCSRVIVESDSLVALNVMLRQRSRSEVVNRLVAKVAMMAALDQKLLSIRYCHVSGTDNGMADALSRLTEGRCIPRALSSAVRVYCPVRDEGFWAEAESSLVVARDSLQIVFSYDVVSMSARGRAVTMGSCVGAVACPRWDLLELDLGRCGPG
ncbi:hypothetical protein FOZ62_017724 [Perkinsus olseni]|uniref:Reverse transcriptase domain-containing protein n=1 Tax=Perkinsus olseni TaxID=32597 RepID=A0A7J6U985_PEROL|nr:hypothetical protein FOZ62_017724 [Perkinsus olseni]